MKTLETDFIFSNAPRYRISRHVLFWLAWWIFFAIIYASKPIGTETGESYIFRVSLGLSAIEALLYMPNHIFFSYFILYFLIPRYLLSGKYLSFLTGLIIASFLSATLSHLITLWTVIPFRTTHRIPVPYNGFFYGLMAGLRGGVQTGGFAAAIKLLKHFYLKQQANQQLEREKLKSELQLLKSQVHPHFLFNTLNNLYSLTLVKSDQAPEIVLKLSGLLHYMLYECNTPKVLLTNEITLINHYIELQKIRYGERLDISLNFSGTMEGKLISPLLLLPFIENSFKHGASEQLDQAWISLDLSVKNDILKFKLINSKTDHGLPYTLENDHSERIGLKNVKKRLDLIYPGQHELRVVCEAETFMVILTLTLENDLTAEKSEPASHLQPYHL